MCTSRFASKQIARNRLISFANGGLGARKRVPFSPDGPYSFPCPPGIRRALQALLASGELRIFAACFIHIQSPKGETSTRWLAGMNSKHKYIRKFRARRTRGIFASYRERETWRSAGDKSYLCRVCAIYRIDALALSRFSPAKKRTNGVIQRRHIMRGCIEDVRGIDVFFQNNRIVEMYCDKIQDCKMIVCNIKSREKTAVILKICYNCKDIYEKQI